MSARGVSLWRAKRGVSEGRRAYGLIYLKVSMQKRTERPTIPPSFDVAKFAKDSDEHIRSVAPVEDALLPSSETRLITRPQMGAAITDEAWARGMVGAPVVVMSSQDLRRLPLDHRAGFLISLMDGTIDLQAVLDVSAMAPDEALRIVRDLFEAGIVEFR
jgi:hypothetical protein